MIPEVEAAAIDAASLIAQDCGLPVEDVVVLQNSNKLGLLLEPAEVFARVAPIGEEVAAFELEVAAQLIRLGAPVVSADPHGVGRVHHRDGFAITLWTHQTNLPGVLDELAYATALHRLHAGLREVDVLAPLASDRVAEAVRLTADPRLSPALAEPDRELLLFTLDDALARMGQHTAGEQLLHGEPHPGNVLNTAAGPLFIDLETVCRGPVEFDLAHVPEAVAAHYPGADPVGLVEARRLVLAMVAAWRCDVADELPRGREHGKNIMALLRQGPPWPTLGALTLA